MRASRSVNAGMTVVARGLSREVAAVVRVAIGVDLVRVDLVDRGVINVGLVEGLEDLTKIVADPAVVDFADRSPVVAEAARRIVETITAIARSARPSSRGRWW